MTVNGVTTTNAGYVSDNHASNSTDLDALGDSIDGRVSVESTHKNASSSDITGWMRGNSDFPGLSYFPEEMIDDQSLIDDEDKNNMCSKRNNNESEIHYDQSPRLRRPRRNSKTSSVSSVATSNSEVVVSSLAKRLTQMRVKEREDAMYDLHGIPLDAECPERMQKLLLKMNQSIEERLQFTKSSYADGDDFGEPDLFPHLTPEEQHEVTSKEIPTSTENNPMDDFSSDDGSSQAPAIHQRIQFLKNDLDDKDFGEGLRLARKQNPDYVYAQRISFLRADRYNVDLASARMIRFFDMKRELFCDPGYNGNDSLDRTGCLGRDLRLSDFSKEELDIWKKTGFFQLCGMRDRAKRPLIVIFGKTMLEENVPPKLFMRAYLYACNIWSRDESTQRTGLVAIAYNLFTTDSDVDEEFVKQYLKQTSILTPLIVKVGMAAQLRSVAIHYCIDHPILNSQYEKIAGYMSTIAAARFKCHYASPKNPESSILSASGDAASAVHSDNASSSDFSAATDPGLNQQRKDTTINPHKELLYMLMTFGIPRDTIPINDVTWEVQVELHRAILEAIEERERLDQALEEDLKLSLSSSANLSSSMTVASSDDFETRKSREKMITSSAASSKLWMSLTASTGSSESFALFPNLFVDGELEEGSDHSARSLMGSAPEPIPKSLRKTGDPVPDISASFLSQLASSLTENSLSGSTPSAPTVAIACDASRRTEVPPSNPSAPILVPTPNDIIMGRGPWNRNHPGNLRLKAMLERERERYESVNRFERMRIVDGMLNELYDDCGARFLYKPKAKKSEEIPGNNVLLVAKRDKAHDKITHDFRNLRRQKNGQQKSNPMNNHKFTGYDV